MNTKRFVVFVLGLALATVAAAGTALSTTHGTNGLILFSQGPDDHFQLFTIRSDGSGVKQITKGAAWVNADWSPDGRSIVAERFGPALAAVVQITATGSGVRTLTPKGTQGQPSFSPDGKWIAYERDVGPGNNGVWLMRHDGTGNHRLTRNPFAGGGDCGCDSDPNFSPDGKVITFVRIKSDGRQQALFAVGANSRGLRQLTPYSWDVAIKHDWSPDGKRILLTTNADFVIPGASANMVTIRPNGTGKSPLTEFTGGSKNAFAGSFSPDGKQVVFRLEEGTTYSLATMDLASRAITKLKTSSDKPRFIDWGTHR